MRGQVLLQPVCNCSLPCIVAPSSHSVTNAGETRRCCGLCAVASLGAHVPCCAAEAAEPGL